MLCRQIRDINVSHESNISPNDESKLKMCGRSYIFTVTLLRVIEMMINFDRDLIISQEGSLGRVFQVI